MFTKLNQKLIVSLILLITLTFCRIGDYSNFIVAQNNSTYNTLFTDRPSTISVKKDITIGKYFQYIDSLVDRYDELTSYKLTEHILVRANPWFIDTLQNTDYYRMMERDSFVYDQKKMIVLTKNSKIIVPDSITASSISNSFKETLIEINIPEFKLRIFENATKLYEFPVRVGRNEKKYLKMGDRITDLKTKTGTGTIVKHVRNPQYYNPVNGHRYYVTKRDDNKTTALPQIPFIETEINGIRHGQLIHPTTNPNTLGKASSNGCIGTKEADSWVIYYYAPIGTKINITYKLNITNGTGEKLTLDNIYGYD